MIWSGITFFQVIVIWSGITKIVIGPSSDIQCTYFIFFSFWKRYLVKDKTLRYAFFWKAKWKKFFLFSPPSKIIEKKVGYAFFDRSFFIFIYANNAIAKLLFLHDVNKSFLFSYLHPCKKAYVGSTLQILLEKKIYSERT